jgi:hypothetical protein
LEPECLVTDRLPELLDARVSGRPPLSKLLADPASMVLRTDLLRAGWPERAVDALFQRSGRRLPGFSRPFVLALDVGVDGDLAERPTRSA